jgi:uncharacterized protein (DUF1015 family)
MEVKAFKAFRFNEQVVGDVGSCISPPYDVISDEQRELLYNKSEHNIVRIINGRTEPGDKDTNNQYTRAAKYLNEWIKGGVLKQDSTESIYGYIQDFEAGGNKFQRYSFIALAKLEDFGQTVQPHEEIMNGPITDRLNLKRATEAKFGLVFMLYEDEQNMAERIIEDASERTSLVDFVDEQGVRHRLYSISRQSDIEAIVEMMKDKKCTIADGHHRYTTGLTYSKESSLAGAAYQMLAFCNTRHEGLLVLATHRLVNNVEGFGLSRLITGLQEKFEVRRYEFDSAGPKSRAKDSALSQMKAAQEQGGNAFVLYGGDGAFYLCVLKDSRAMDAAAQGKSKAWKSLDVAVLHKLVFEELLGIDQKKLASQSNIEYVKDTSTAIDDSIARVDKGEQQAAFLMNPPKLEQIQQVADAGERMPQKSTYFYPKIHTGLTINKL